MKVLTSYKDTKENSPYPIKNNSPDTKAGMENCAEETRKYAKAADDAPPPENTRSDPADRIRRWREGVSWKTSEEAVVVRESPLYKKCAKFLIRCVLSSVYGENIIIDAQKAADLKQNAKQPGRALFVDAILDALDMGQDTIRILRRRDGKLIGLLSSAGPIPAAEDAFDLPELNLDEDNLEALLKDRLSNQDKQVLLYWLEIMDGHTSCLYNDLHDILKNIARVSLTDFEKQRINRILAVSEKDGSVDFPVLKEHSDAVLHEKITLVPIKDNKQRFGYGPHPLYVETDGLCYVFLPPFTKEIVDATKTENFSIENIELIRDNLKLEGDKLVSVAVRCVLENNGFSQVVRKTYTDEQIRFVKAFPSLSVYGPAPKNGWIARRDAPLRDYPSPLKSGAEESFDMKDIVFEDLIFEETGNNYAVHRGEIPKWIGARVEGVDWLGAIPARAVKNAADWQRIPNFIHTSAPSGKMIAVADIGSSRSAVLFQKAGDNRREYTLVENGQVLGVPLTSTDDTVADSNFGVMFFLPEKQVNDVKGKTPVGLLTTNKYQNENLPETSEVALYKSGKVILLDPKSIAEVNSRKILSDIKAGADANAMFLLAQGMLSMIVDRAVHLECSNIELRLSYLIERYAPMEKAWNDAINAFKELFPDILFSYDDVRNGEKVRIEDKVNMYLPESLAIANRLKSDGKFHTTSGAAIVDIGDFTTDIALFRNAGGHITLEENGNVSILFAGRQIIIQPIWDYLQFSGVKVENLFNPLTEESKQAVKRLEDALKEQKKEKKEKMPDDVRRDILCLMNNLRREKIPTALQNLFDICYLTEIVLLKCLLREREKGEGQYDIHLFGGGSALIKDKSEGFDWDAVLKRNCGTQKRSGDGNILAEGLLEEIQPDLRLAASKMKEDAMKYQNDASNTVEDVSPTSMELKEGYIQFLKNAQALKKWEALDVNNNRVSPGKLFNIKKPGPDADGEIDDNRLYSSFYDAALEFAMKGSFKDKEIIKTLFAYKIAYSSAVAFYSKRKR
ncbi:MAG: hypothetical protein LBG43_09175 [Treponema sp.]|jgi:hypothetical protein|nr:hypothetical protein [Treponema sp.]